MSNKNTNNKQIINICKTYFIFNPCSAEFIIKKMKNYIFVFSTNSGIWDRGKLKSFFVKGPSKLLLMIWCRQEPVSWALQNNVVKIYNAENYIYRENYKLKLCMCAARLWAHIPSFSLKLSSEVQILHYTNFKMIFWRARKTLMKHTPTPRPACFLFSFGEPVYFGE